ncbi:MAG: hypothetical protein CMI70_03315 [Candidatus Pelagibacter sp.]|jgi:hypothetical protein|nr:hypothetical protein [Candidatus Pelagibacter sp.]|tara:strand:- start:268 stop:1758 length:1491 start_codon:yes stop_codon:yes gene_type:complete
MNDKIDAKKMKKTTRYNIKKDTLTYLNNYGKLKMYKLPINDYWHYEFWIAKCSTFPNGKRERKSTFESKFLVAKEIAIENYIAYQTAKKNNKVNQIAKITNKNIKNSFAYVGQLFLHSKDKDVETRIKNELQKVVKRNPQIKPNDIEDRRKELTKRLSSTNNTYRLCYNLISKDFGSKDINEIEANDIDNWLQEQKENKVWSSSYTEKYKLTFNVILKFALNNKDDTDNYFIKRLPKLKSIPCDNSYLPGFNDKEKDMIFAYLKQKSLGLTQFEYEKLSKDKKLKKQVWQKHQNDFEHFALNKDRSLWYELHDSTIFYYGSFLRAGTEFGQLRFKDVEIDPNFILNGRRNPTLRVKPEYVKVAIHDHPNYTSNFCVGIFKNCLIRYEGVADKFLFFNDEYPTLVRRNQFGKFISSRFKNILLDLKIRKDKKTGINRSFRCLRNTALTVRRENSPSSAVSDIASNARTSTAMLERFYNREINRKEIAQRALSIKSNN